MHTASSFRVCWVLCACSQLTDSGNVHAVRHLGFHRYHTPEMVHVPCTIPLIPYLIIQCTHTHTHTHTCLYLSRHCSLCFLQTLWMHMAARLSLHSKRSPVPPQSPVGLLITLVTLINYIISFKFLSWEVMIAAIVVLRIIHASLPLL